MSGVPFDTLYVKLGATVMTRKHRFGKLRFADSYLPYGLFVLISLALAGCSGASPGAVVPEPTTGTLDMTPEPPQPTVTILADSDMVAAGDPVSYTVNASPAPIADLTVHVMFTGAELAAEPLPTTITIDAGEDAAMLTVPTATTGPSGMITALVTEGDGYTVGPAASALVTVTASSTAPTGPAITGPVIPGTVIRPPPPANSVTITAVTDSVVEGDPVRFRVTATPAPAQELELNVLIEQTGPTRGIDDFPRSVTIPASSTSMELTLTTTNDSVAESAGTVTARLDSVTPSTYSIRSPASATVTVTDDDAPLQNSVIISAVTDSVVEGKQVRFRVTAGPAPAEDLTLSVTVEETGPMRTTIPTIEPVTILASTTSMELPPLVTTNDNVAKRSGTVTATLTGVTSGPAAYSIGSPASATVTVTDRDRSTATISLLPASVASGAVLTITVNMMPALAATEPVRVGVSDSGPPAATYYDVTFAGDILKTVTHTVATGHDAATDRITAVILPPPSGAPYVIGDPWSVSVDVTD